MGFLSGAADVLGALAGTTEGNSQSPDIIMMNPEMPTGYRIRELMSWRIPGIGYVEMYVNPRSLTISEKRVLQDKELRVVLLFNIGEKSQFL